MVKIISHRSEVNRRLLKGFESAIDRYDEANHEVIREARDWGSGFGTTYRRNGEVVSGGYRNIVDLANLDESQKVERTGPMSAQLSWDGGGETPVVLVHEGDGKIPARRWTRVAAIEGRLGEAFIEGFEGA